VLDFGLAKMTTPSAFTAAAEDATRTLAEHMTSPGLAVGTISYRSPEQMRAKDLDSRSDLFSFGVALYEMATGILPFRGETSAVIASAILERDPVPVTQISPSLPAELERIIRKALEKDRDLRYSSAADLRADLKRLSRDTSAGREYQSAALIAAASTAPAAAVSTLSAFPQTLPAGKRRPRWVVAGAALPVVLAAVAYLVFRPTARPAFEKVEMQALTDTGDMFSAAISPDGKYVAMVRRENRLGDFAARSTNSLPYGRGSDWVAVWLQPLTEPHRKGAFAGSRFPPKRSRTHLSPRTPPAVPFRDRIPAKPWQTQN